MDDEIINRTFIKGSQGAEPGEEPEPKRLISLVYIYKSSKGTQGGRMGHQGPRDGGGEGGGGGEWVGGWVGKETLTTNE